jgi:hypothetical protein
VFIQFLTFYKERRVLLTSALSSLLPPEEREMIKKAPRKCFIQLREDEEPPL